MGLFGNATGIIGHRPVGICSQRDPQRRKHTHRCDGYPVKTSKFISDQNGNHYEYDRGRRAQHSGGKPTDDEGAGSGLSSFGNGLRRLVTVRGIVFDAQPD